MAYQVLARKWRPQQFSALVGQEHVVRALNNALAQNRLHHAYLFTGTRGVGKTTLARIFAKSLNCETGVTPTPCGQCSTCLEIERGNFVDLIEVDAASRTKVEDTREILDNVQYRPSRGRYKVYLIDEVHMLSRHSFNALLKTLEEPPEHVKFLLATTDPQKLPVTILSRCLQFNLKSLSPELISNHLSYVLGEEQLGFEAPALKLLAKAANGSMRDALSLTDQAIAHGNGQVLLDNVQSMLGTLDNRHAEHLLAAVVAGEGATLLAAIEQVAMMSPDYHGLLGDLLTLLHQAAIAQQLPGTQEEAAEQLATALSPQQLQLFYQMVLHGRRDLPFCPDPRMALEMTLLRMLAFDIDNQAQPVPAPRAKAPLPRLQAMPAAQQAELKPVVVEPVAPVMATPAQAPAPEIEPAPSPATAPRPVMQAPPVVHEDDLAAQQAHLMAMAEAQGFRPQGEAVSPSAPAPQPAQQPVVDAKAPAPANPTDQMLAARQAIKARQEGDGTKKPEAAPVPKPVERRPAAQSVPAPVKNEPQPAPALVEAGWDDAPPWLDDEPQPISEGLVPPWLEDEPQAATLAELAPVPQRFDAPAPGQPLAGGPAANGAAARHEEVASGAPAGALGEDSVGGPAGTPSGDSLGSPKGAPYPGVTKALAEAREDDRFWFECCEQLPIGGFVRQLALNSVWQPQGQDWLLLLTPAQKHLARNLEDLADALAQAGLHEGQLQVQVAEHPEGRESPLALSNRILASCQAHAEASLAQDPRVGEFITLFDAELVADSVRPIM
ncbi:DNA polymerase III subunit gamma/tau [Gallaecimonas kandeliae]|uniref:DNA polymerase III subunit gamma/tau n=1 Tax=Gallaecimonas kandeliae TaxID=3029055 RepID=UPI0026492F78|nr:DNA polymerase III subunit gamma/tau [Gallaecimonas kandeliae]WKE64438.1 DNA polymerase III subunit gamma/tau [Gallaecimonas kandeliae]